MAISTEDDVFCAEDQLSRGLVKDAHSSALKALKAVHDPRLLGRGCSVLIQADFQCNRLTDVEALLQQSGHTVCQLPVPTILLWGVVAIELGQANAARTTLSKYVAKCSSNSGLSREDVMALSRLYAVQLLGNTCHDFAAAAIWLEAGGAGLSVEQQELLLLELEEAEEVLQEERLADWAATHAATAADDDDTQQQSAAAAAAARLSSTLTPLSNSGFEGPGLNPCHNCHMTDADNNADNSADNSADDVSVCVSDLGPSASAALSGSSCCWGEERATSGGSADAGLPPQAAAAAAAAGTGDQAAAAAAAGDVHEDEFCVGGQSCWNAAVDQLVLGQGATATALLPAAAAAAGEAVDAATSTDAGQQQQQQGQHISQSAAAAATAAGDSPCVTVTGMLDEQQQRVVPVVPVDQENLFCTMTGLLVDEEDEAPALTKDDDAVTAAAATAAAATAAAATAADGLTAVRSSIADSSSSSSSSVKSRDQAGEGFSERPVLQANITGQPRSSSDKAAADDPPPLPQQQQQQQQQSLMDWMSCKASEAWQSETVQGTLEALNLNGLESWELAGVAGLALLLSYGVYRKRKTIKRAAADVAGGLMQTAQMAVGMAINPMAAVPSAGHVMR